MSKIDTTLDFGKLVHVSIDWDKIHTIDTIKKVLKAYYGTIGVYTDDPVIIKLGKSTNE